MSKYNGLGKARMTCCALMGANTCIVNGILNEKEGRTAARFRLDNQGIPSAPVAMHHPLYTSKLVDKPTPRP